MAKFIIVYTKDHQEYTHFPRIGLDVEVISHNSQSGDRMDPVVTNYHVFSVPNERVDNVVAELTRYFPGKNVWVTTPEALFSRPVGEIKRKQVLVDGSIVPE